MFIIAATHNYPVSSLVELTKMKFNIDMSGSSFTSFFYVTFFLLYVASLTTAYVLGEYGKTTFYASDSEVGVCKRNPIYLYQK